MKNQGLGDKENIKKNQRKASDHLQNPTNAYEKQCPLKEKNISYRKPIQPKHLTSWSMCVCLKTSNPIEKQGFLHKQ